MKVFAGLLLLFAGTVAGYLIGVRNNSPNHPRVFMSPEGSQVRRVMAVPGDRVEIKAGTVYLNGKPLAAR
jgi:type IV secretory pathway protease TraF